MKSEEKIKRYKEIVLNNYYVYNSLFMNLPYEKMENIGMLIPVLYEESKTGFAEGKDPIKIMDAFFDRQTVFETEEKRISFLFRLIQYVERQVVLFDSVEDASFKEVVKMTNTQSFEDLYQIAQAKGLTQELIQKLSDFAVRIVFTAHPTQFYPTSIQGIIQDLRTAISNSSINEIDLLLQQLGVSSFINKKKPTPFDEAKSIIQYLRYVYYDAIGGLFSHINKVLPQGNRLENNDLIQLGFWPGGDRDGNPFVTADITRDVADELRTTLMKCYYNELKALRRRLTFRKIATILNSLSDRLYKNMFAIHSDLEYQQIIEPLVSVREILIEEYNSLYLEQLDNLITKVQIFKMHFACLDIRQDSRKHEATVKAIIEKYRLTDKDYEDLSKDELIKILTESEITANEYDFRDELIADTIRNVKQIKTIQKLNGEQGANRYIISNSEDIFAVLNVYGLFKFCGWKDEEISIDIIPLFETIKGLSSAYEVMDYLYQLPIYSKHLERRQGKQVIMLGFSDGTKDGGYLKANWEIFNTKEILSKVSDKHNIKVVFFDGRGGPPARGGGKTNRFYAAQGKHIANNEIQLTIQGQTVTSMYGTIDQFTHNCEQLINVGISNDIFDDKENQFDTTQRALMDELAEISYQKYEALKQHPQFVPYLEKMSTLKYYGKANIGSRPAKRGNTKQLTLSDLRAISFVGSWSQLKQNVPGYFGIGTAILKLKNEGRLTEVKELYKHQAFFKTLILNSMMSLTKTFFPLTSYMKQHPEFGDFWDILHEEYQLSKSLMLEITGYEELMEEEPLSKSSVEFREKMVLPLLTIQQYALQKIAADDPKKEIYEKMVTRSLYGNINASRNSA